MCARTENTSSGLLVPREKKLMMRGLVFGGLLVPWKKLMVCGLLFPEIKARGLLLA
jgi:hypothetical protein